MPNMLHSGGFLPRPLCHGAEAIGQEFKGMSKLKEIAYFSMVRSLLEYSCPVWDPYR